ncbi:hypothetical protein [Kitasatospora sp. NPDC101183]|uniref:hypothetical protein n=1 Tax=Kitasatospora sp. NPDC101183 TaxID=3364100 RepID=UPI0037FF1B77
MNDQDTDGSRLSTAFERTMAGVGTDLAPLITAGARQGRSLRRRRRLVAAAAVTAAAALAVGGTVALRTDGTGGASVTAAAQASAGGFPQPRHHADDYAEGLYPGDNENTGKVTLTGHAALAALVKALPPGARTSDYAGHHARTHSSNASLPDEVFASGGMLYDDGAGPALVQVVLQANPGTLPGAPGPEERHGCATVNKDGRYRYCWDGTLPDGSRLLLLERAEGESLQREARVLRPDRTEVSVTASNLAEVDGHAKPQVVREGLPLGLDQLKAAALSPDLRAFIGVDEAERAGRTIRPFHDDSPHSGPTSPPATPR